MATTFLWHDYETFGLSPSQDRPAQFAAIRTDENLNIMGDSMCWYCQPAMDTLPSPESILITHILPQECEEKGMKEAEFAQRILEQMSEPETISVGYNNMSFDDEVTRFMLWRNLFDPYAREWKGGCSRFDLFALVIATWALRPEGIIWPEVELENGTKRPSFRLENLTKANGLVHEHAHDALSDVLATIDVARLIAQKQPKLWQFALKNRSKNTLKELVNARKPLVWIASIHGVENGYTRLVLPIGQDPNNPNSILMWDLQHDPRELLRLTAEEIKTRLFKRESELPEGVSRLPIFSCKINQSPFLVAHLGVLSEERAALFKINKALAIENAAFLVEHMDKVSSLWAEALERKSDTETVDVDNGLYAGGFTSNHDRSQMDFIHRQTPQALAQLVESQRIHFDDPRFEELLFRFRARNWPETLSEEESQRWLELRVERLIHGVGVKRTLDDFAQELDSQTEKLGEHIDEKTEELFGSLYDWAERISNSLDNDAF